MVQRFQVFRFSLSFLSTIHCLMILFFTYAPLHEVSRWPPQTQTSCYFQAQRESTYNQEKEIFQKLLENIIVQNWVIQKRMKTSVFHPFLLYSGRWIRKIIGYAFWVNQQTLSCTKCKCRFPYIDVYI